MSKESENLKELKKSKAQISAKQKQILEFLISRATQQTYPPTMREIGNAVALKSTSTVHSHLEKLEKCGYIKRNGSKSRTIELADKSKRGYCEVKYIPALKKLSLSLFDEANIESYFPIPADHVKDDACFMVYAQDDAMKNSGILNGDLVLARQQQVANNGDVVITVLENSNSLFLIRTFFRTGKKIRLQAANDSFKDTIVSDCPIFGKLIGLYRRY